MKRSRRTGSYGFVHAVGGKRNAPVQFTSEIGSLRHDARICIALPVIAALICMIELLLNLELFSFVFLLWLLGTDPLALSSIACHL